MGNLIFCAVFPVGSLSFLTMSQTQDIFATCLKKPSLNENIVFCLASIWFPVSL